MTVVALLRRAGKAECPVCQSGHTRQVSFPKADLGRPVLPGARCTRGPACNCYWAKGTRAYRFSGGNPAFPARWVTAYSALSWVTGLSCHPHPRKVLLPANLTPASGCQDHTASPSATAALVIRRHRLHRIPPHVRDDREPPLSSGGTVLQ